MNVVTHDEAIARATRLRLWAEHLERDEKDVAGSPPSASWTSSGGRSRPSSSTGSSGGEPLTHRLVRLPGVSRRRRRVFGSLQSHLYDI